MSFGAAVDHLHALSQELAPASAATPRRKFDIAHMRILARALGDPQRKFPSILIAGTNGKGSTASTLASILTAAGLRTGLYTSPHLARVTERIRLSEPSVVRSTFSVDRSETAAVANGQRTTDNELRPSPLLEIPEEAFARLYFQVDDAARRLVADGELPHHPSFFESLTALAFLYFADAQPDGTFGTPVDLAVLEVGMGGRLDATNIVEPVLSILTDIALDHQDYLGDTIAAIAREKAGILRAGGTLITLPQHPEANQAIGEAAVALGVRAINAAEYLPDVVRSPLSVHRSRTADSGQAATNNVERTTYNPLSPNHYDLQLGAETLHVRSPLAGEHQRRNLALAIAAAVELRNQSSDKYDAPLFNGERTTENGQRFPIPNAAIEAGIAATAWPGRLEFLPPNLLLDVAHNPAGAWTLRAAIASLPEDQPRTLIFSCLRDKDLREMAQILFPLFDSSASILSSGSNSTPSTLSSRSEAEGSASPSAPAHHLILTPVDNPRAASLDDLIAAARALDVPAQAAASAADALALARRITPPGGLILATGSIYLVGALRELALAQ